MSVDHKVVGFAMTELRSRSQHTRQPNVPAPINMPTCRVQTERRDEPLNHMTCLYYRVAVQIVVGIHRTGIPPSPIS
jgi:hypothetical protein